MIVMEANEHEPHDQQPQDSHDPPATPRATALMWGGVGLGVLLVLFLLTRGFGLLGRSPSPEEAPATVRQGDKIFVPENSALRQRLAVMAQMRMIHAAAALGLLGLARNPEAPTLVVWGKQDKLIPVTMGERYAAGIRGAKLVSLDKCGHVPPIEKTEEFLAAVTAFLGGGAAGTP